MILWKDILIIHKFKKLIFVFLNFLKFIEIINKCQEEFEGTFCDGNCIKEFDFKSLKYLFAIDFLF